MKTITAIATPLMKCAIHIIRISGDDAYEIVNSIIDKPITKEPYKISRANIYDNGELVDDVLLLKYVAPKSYTGEDMVEITCHGSVYVAKKILSLLIEHGASMADHGEFTKRAFLNNKITLLQAEGINNVINSNSEKSLKIANKCTNKKMSDWIQKMADDLFKITGQIEVNIDYPEYEDIDVLTTEEIKPQIINFKSKLINILNKSESNKIINEGIKVGIIGRPNVGKSSLLNNLLEEEKAIVTDIEGTTREIVEGKINLNGIILNIIDTAGIRKTDNVVEKIGVEKSLNIINKSDLIILMLNNNESLTEEDKQLLNLIKNKPNIILVNKNDLETKINYKDLPDDIIKISITNNEGIDELKQRIIKLFNLGKLETEDLTYLSDARSISLLEKSLDKINDSIKSIENNEPIDIVELNIKESWNILGEIIGETYTDELIDELFSRFCLGK